MNFKKWREFFGLNSQKFVNFLGNLAQICVNFAKNSRIKFKGQNL